MKKLFTLSLLLVFGHSFAFDDKLKNVDDIAYNEDMDFKALQWHRLIDESLTGQNKNISAIENTAASLNEKPTDKDLAKLVVIVNRAPEGTAPDAQTARVYIDGRLEKTFKVSTGALGYETAVGYFRPVYTNHLRFYHEYYSGKYSSRMARAIFFYGGYAIHHTDAVSKLGKRASHGCVRFHINDIDWINSTAKELGNQNYEIRKWHHENLSATKMNIHYKGLERTDINPIDRYSGKINYTKTIPSLDMVILVKDERK